MCDVTDIEIQFNDILVRSHMWEVAGGERFGNMTRLCYTEAVGAVVVFDVARIETFESVLFWKSDLDAKVTLPDGSPIPVVLLANNLDDLNHNRAPNHLLSLSQDKKLEMNRFCEENGFIGWIESLEGSTSGFQEAFTLLLQFIFTGFGGVIQKQEEYNDEKKKKKEEDNDKKEEEEEEDNDKKKPEGWWERWKRAIWGKRGL